MTFDFDILDEQVEIARDSSTELRTVGDILHVLADLPRSTRVVAYSGNRLYAFDGDVSSYRGYYDDVAFGYHGDVAGAVTAGELARTIRKTLGTSLLAHKGGDTDPVTETTRVWLSREGHADSIVFSHMVRDNSCAVFIVENLDS